MSSEIVHKKVLKFHTELTLITDASWNFTIGVVIFVFKTFFYFLPFIHYSKHSFQTFNSFKMSLLIHLALLS